MKRKFIIGAAIFICTFAILSALAVVIDAANTPLIEVKHECIDTTHATCDGVCICDGIDCK